MKLENIIKRGVDLHVHVFPDLLKRKFDQEELVKIERGRIAGFGLKSHGFPIISIKKGVLGSVVLNNHVGGLNCDIITACSNASKSKIIVWFPTINAKNHLDKSKYEIRPEWSGKNVGRLSGGVKGISVIKNGKLTEKSIDILETIKYNKAILATGHLSWQESRLLVKKAYDTGIKNIIITHPIYQLIDMPVEIQKELSSFAFIEHTYSMYSIDKIPIRKIAGQIKAMGAERCILSSDVGQPFSPYPSEALRNFISLLNKENISMNEIKKMLVKNPNRIIR